MVKILFLGDFLYDYSIIKEDILRISNWIRSNNYKVILNLEAPLSNNGKKINKRGPNLYQSSVTCEILKNLNVIGVCLSNNHMMDYGEVALKETLELLKKNNIAYTGAGFSTEEATKPMEFLLDEQKVIIQNYGWDVEETVYVNENMGGCSPKIEEIILKNTRELRKSFPKSKIINVFHWGFEYNLYPMPLDINLAHQTINSGCDLIIGHHPHNIQPYECYEEKEIYYSLGNFYFGSRRSNFTKKKMKHYIDSMCDYGLMVGYNVETNKTDYMYIKYDIEKNESNVLSPHSDENELKLTDITNINYKNETYVKKVKDYSSNINPVLTLDNKTNEIAISNLFKYYRRSRLKGNIKLTILKLPYFKLIVKVVKEKMRKQI